MAQSTSWVVLKFGGTSVSTADRWARIAAEARARLDAGERPVLVCSALSQVSNQLEAALVACLRGDHDALVDRLVHQHEALAADLGLPGLPDTVSALLDDLRRLLLGASLIGEVSPRQHARVMSAGELLSTRLGEAALAHLGLPVAWVDARGLLTSVAPPSQRPELRYLSASVDDAADPSTGEALRAALDDAGAEVVLTQGFIARDGAGDTVLLGRGGSDTSAALLGARLSARRVEIWTDVPGLFSADPRQVPTARLLPSVDYAIAQELASTGAKVLHPRCLPPLARHGIPLGVRCTPRPELPSTTITAEASTDAPRVHAISSRRGLTLVALDGVDMWRQAGFLADAFACFKARGVSVDLVSTAETNVTVSLDPVGNALVPEVLDGLLADLSELCTARLIERCAAVTLVGTRIRGLVHRLGPALEVFEEQTIHLMSQAANDLNLTFVVDEDQADRLVASLHELLFAHRADDAPTWRELFEPEAVSAPDGAAEVGARWWVERADELIALAAEGPAYVYDAATVARRAAELTGLRHVDRVLYATKANHHPELLRQLYAAGVGLECVSPGEIEHVFESVPGVDPSRVLFTPNFAPREEYAHGFERGVNVTLDNLHPLEAWPEVFAGREVFVRLDPGKGRGHHAHVRTAGARSKFGVAPDQIERVAELAAAHDVSVVGLHAHTGSGIRTPHNWAETALYLAHVAERFGGTVRHLDLGGGLGVVERPGEAPLDLASVDERLAAVRASHPGFELWLEPGRFLVAEAGVLLARVTQRKQKGPLAYVGIETGMNTLLRPALYGSWHRIVNLSRLGETARERVNVVGPICESGDTLGVDRRLAPAREGDVLLIDVAGAYGRAMSSHYNLRDPAREVVLPPRPTR